MASARYTGIVAGKGMDGRIGGETAKWRYSLGGKCSRRETFQISLAKVL
jgi:hypothetical protein